jgi:hypothetical protein
MKGSFDIGASRFVIKEVGSLEWKVYTTASGHASQNAEYFWADGGGSKGATWDGTNFWALGTNGKLYKHTSVGAGSGVSGGSSLTGFKVAYTWYDSDATGGNHETNKSPNATITLLKRARLTVTAPAIPGAGGVDDADSIRVYAGSVAAPGTVTLQSTSAVGVHSVVYNSLVIGAAPPGANNFPSSIPAKIKNAGSTLVISGDGTILADSITLPEVWNTYTPTVGNTGTATYTTRTGYWRYIAPKLVWFSCFIVVNVAGSGTGIITVTTPTNIHRLQQQIMPLWISDMIAAGALLGGYAICFTSGTGNIIDRLRRQSNAGTNNMPNLIGSDMLSGGAITITGTYREA